MTCNRAMLAMSAVADGESLPEERVALEAHVDACASCARRYERVLAVRQAMRSAVPEWTNAAPRPRTSMAGPVAAAAVASALIVFLYVSQDLPPPPVSSTATVETSEPVWVPATLPTASQDVGARPASPCERASDCGPAARAEEEELP